MATDPGLACWWRPSVDHAAPGEAPLPTSAVEGQGRAHGLLGTLPLWHRLRHAVVRRPQKRVQPRCCGALVPPGHVSLTMAGGQRAR